MTALKVLDEILYMETVKLNLFSEWKLDEMIDVAHSLK